MKELRFSKKENTLLNELKQMSIRTIDFILDNLKEVVPCSFILALIMLLFCAILELPNIVKNIALLVILIDIIVIALVILVIISLFIGLILYSILEFIAKNQIISTLPFNQAEMRNLVYLGVNNPARFEIYLRVYCYKKCILLINTIECIKQDTWNQIWESVIETYGLNEYLRYKREYLELNSLYELSDHRMNSVNLIDKITKLKEYENEISNKFFINYELNTNNFIKTVILPMLVNRRYPNLAIAEIEREIN